MLGLHSVDISNAYFLTPRTTNDWEATFHSVIAWKVAPSTRTKESKKLYKTNKKLCALVALAPVFVSQAHPVSLLSEDSGPTPGQLNDSVPGIESSEHHNPPEMLDGLDGKATTTTTTISPPYISLFSLYSLLEWKSRKLELISWKSFLPRPFWHPLHTRASIVSHPRPRALFGNFLKRFRRWLCRHLFL